jgi:hypothetical protein
VIEKFIAIFVVLLQKVEIKAEAIFVRTPENFLNLFGAKPVIA